jgi:hypothetical protein
MTQQRETSLIQLIQVGFDLKPKDKFYLSILIWVFGLLIYKSPGAPFLWMVFMVAIIVAGSYGYADGKWWDDASGKDSPDQD